MRLPSTDRQRGLAFIAQLEGECPIHWVPLHGRQQVWCGPYCSAEFDAEHGCVLDWRDFRRRALERDSFTCQGCGLVAATPPDMNATGTTILEVDHIVEIQDGGAEFDLSNLRTLCHACHATKTAARRRYGPKAAEEALYQRNHPELLPPLEAFL